MGRGRKPKPTVLKLLDGNPGRTPINLNEPKPKKGLPSPPRHLSPGAKKVWKQLKPQLEGPGIATQIDAVAFGLLCTAYSDYQDACQKVADHGAVWIEKGDGAIPKFAYSPYWSIANREWAKIHKMLAEFGMTPSSRTKVTAIPQDNTSRDDQYFG